MPAFDTTAVTSGGKDWALFQNGHVHLYWRAQVLDETISWLSANGYQIFAIDAAHWADAADMHSDLGRALDFPNYYGRNLNALNDCLRDVALYEYGAQRDSAGTVLVLNHFDSFARADREVAQALLDICAGVARMANLVGHRMLCLVQSDDPGIEFEPVGATSVTWNPQEWQRGKRITR